MEEAKSDCKTKYAVHILTDLIYTMYVFIQNIRNPRFQL